MPEEKRLFSVEREQQILDDIAKPVTDLIEVHKASTTDWDPTDYIPYHLGRTYASYRGIGDGQPWTPDDYPLDDRYRDALYINLATEDNLPLYFAEINSHAPAGHPLKEWTRIWTKEEAQHADLIANWARVTRALDPQQMKYERDEQMLRGESPHATTAVELFAYASLQELATAVSHRGTIPFLDKEYGGQRAMGRVAKDEQHHCAFYTGALKAVLDVDPTVGLQALDYQLRHFAMPGKEGIPNFQERSRTVEEIGVYGTRLHLEKVVNPTLKALAIDDLPSLSEAGEKARARIHRYQRGLGALVTRAGL